MPRLLALLLLLSLAGAVRADESAVLANSRQLIFEGKRSGEGYFSADGNLLIFQSERDPANPFYQMFLLDLLSGESARVSPGTGKTTCGFLQPGTSRVLFASTHLDPEAVAKQKAELEFRASGKTRRYSWDYDPEMDIFTANEDGTQLQRLTEARGYDAECAFSPDGKKIVFTSNRTAYDHELTAEEKTRLEKDPAWFGDIYVMNADGSDQRRLTTTPGYDGGPFFSPDGERIVWRRFDAGGLNADVFTMALDGSDVRRITDFHSMSWAPFFHPSGGYIIFTSNKLGFENFELYIVDAQGEREPVRVTFTDGFDGLPTFSPDGKKLCWTSARTADKKAQIFLADWNHPAAIKALGDSPKRPLTEEEKMAAAAKADALEQKVIALENATSPMPAKGVIVELKGQGSQLTAAISASDLKAEVSWLADPAREGRMTGSPGARASAEWLAAYFKAVGLEPVAGEAGQLPGRVGVPSAGPGVPPGQTSQIGSVSTPPNDRSGKLPEPPGGTPTPPASDLSAYFEPFEFDAGVKLLPGKNSFILSFQREEAPTAPSPGQPAQPAAVKESVLSVDSDFRPLSFSDNGKIEGEVVFAGYGLSVPEDHGGAIYNSYEGLDVTGKIVLILRYVPEGVDAKRRAQLNRYAGLRYKAMMARERGAKAVIFVAGPNSPQAGDLIPLAGDGTLGGSGITAVSVSGKVADALFAPSGKTLKGLQTGLDTENPHAEGGFVLPKVRVNLETGVEHLKQTGRNVLAYLPPGVSGLTAPPVPLPSDGVTPPSAPSFPPGSEPLPASQTPLPPGKKPLLQSKTPLLQSKTLLLDGVTPPPGTEPGPEPEIIVVGAHYDHLGNGKNSSSMAHSGEEGQVHPGADDNGSGVAAVMELAASLAQERAEHPERFPRGIVFACWSGEEIGLIGSAAFCANPPVPLGNVAAYVNFDMIGRLRDNKLTLQGVGSSSVWRKLIEKRNVAAGFNLALQDDPYLPTDTTSFYPKRIPVLNFFTGAHEDYHRPTDTAEKLDYPGTERIVKLARGLISDLVAAPVRPDLARVEKRDEGGGSRETLRAYLGTIPDYTTEVKGVKLSGVRGGSPAEKGGLQGGDVLVEFAGQKLTNIYDYTYALDAVKIGTPVKAVVERDGKRVELTLTPEARK